MTGMTQRKQLLIRVSADTHRKLQTYAVLADVSMQRLVEGLIEAHLAEPGRAAMISKVMDQGRRLRGGRDV